MDDDYMKDDLVRSFDGFKRGELHKQYVRRRALRHESLRALTLMSLKPSFSTFPSHTPYSIFEVWTGPLNDLGNTSWVKSSSLRRFSRAATSISL